MNELEIYMADDYIRELVLAFDKATNEIRAINERLGVRPIKQGPASDYMHIWYVQRMDALLEEIDTTGQRLNENTLLVASSIESDSPPVWESSPILE